MAVINFARREIEAKVVYYGPAFSGKTTNVRVLHTLVPSPQRGDLHTLATAEDRTLFFDYVPVQLGQIAGFAARFKLFTVPGQIVYHDTRRVVLQGADAVVFVADSAPDRADANLDSLVELEENLRNNGLDLSSIPLVIQLNKRDVAGARPVAAMVADLNPFGVPVVEAVAESGKGVLDTLRQVIDIAATRIRENLSGQQTAVKLTAIERAEAEDDRRIIKDHLDRIRSVRPAEEERERQVRAASRINVERVDAFLSANVERSGEKAGERPAEKPAPRPGGESRAGVEARAVTESRVPAPARNEARPKDGADRVNLRPDAPTREPRPKEGGDRASSRPDSAAKEARPREAGAPVPGRDIEGRSGELRAPTRSVETDLAAKAGAKTTDGRTAAARPKVVPEGAPLLAQLAEEHGSPREILGGLIGPDGRVRVEVVLEKNGVQRRHTVTLGPETQAAGSVSTVMAGAIGLGVGAMVGGICGGLMTTWLTSP